MRAVMLLLAVAAWNAPAPVASDNTEVTFGPPSVTGQTLRMALGDQGECDRITSGDWDLSEWTLDMHYARRIHPHENSVFVLVDGVDSLTGTFKEVRLPDGDLCEIEYDYAAGRVVAHTFRPDRAPAFPGAEGFGKYAIGGRGGKVYTVTNLNDSGPGSLREACEAEGPRTVVFHVSGTISLESEIRIRHPYITIAGQTAPGDGICIKDYMMRFDADHVVIRYMRFRPGDRMGREHDGFGGDGNHVIIDHCSVSWSVDEALSINKSANLTVQWCLVSESLYRSIHKKGDHGYGGLWGGPGGSFHHNILAHHSSRNPRASGNANSGLLDFRNNVIYNWGFNSAYGGEIWPRNWIDNYYKPGPATRQSVLSRIFIQKDARGRMHAAGNVMVGAPAVTADNWKGIHFHGDGDATEQTLRVDTPFAVAPVTTHSAEEAYERVLALAGCSLRRDSVDARIVEEIRTGTARFGASFDGGGNGIIDSQEDVGGWPELEPLPAPADSDGDGIPDDWERANGLDAHDPADGNHYHAESGYTNLEVYLASLSAR